MADDGVVNIASNYAVKETIDRLETLVRDKGITVFARIDHAAGATSVGMALRPMELLIFGDPRAGTPLMQERQIVGIDLPLKMLGWEDEAGRVWLSYIDLRWLADRHRLGDGAKGTVDRLAATLAVLAESAATSSRKIRGTD
jgi:uncharacterized protein (DUF302 family)